MKTSTIAMLAAVLAVSAIPMAQANPNFYDTVDELASQITGFQGTDDQLWAALEQSCLGGKTKDDLQFYIVFHENYAGYEDRFVSVFCYSDSWGYWAVTYDTDPNPTHAKFILDTQGSNGWFDGRHTKFPVLKAE